MAAKGETLEYQGCRQRSGILLLTLTATLVAALGLARPAWAGESDPAAPDAVAEGTTSAAVTTPTTAAAPATAPASQAGGGETSGASVELEPEAPVALEPEKAPEPAETPAPADSSPGGSTQEAPSSGTPAADPAETEPAETEPADTTPAETEPSDEEPAEGDPAGCTSPPTEDDNPATDAATDGAAADASACPATDDETPASCTGETSASGTSDGATPTACAAPTESAPTAPTKPAQTTVVVPATPPSTPAPAAPTGPTVLVLVVNAAAADTAAATSDDTAPAAPEKPVALVALPSALPPTRERQIRLEGAASDKAWLGAVRALSPLRTIPHSARGCIQPNGLVPLSNACMTARARAGPLLAMRLEVWPTIPTSAAEINQAARDVARAHDRHPARAVKKTSKPPTLERAPVSRQQHGPWVTRGVGGGSAAGSVVLRIFALAALVALPFALPRGFRVALRRSLVPTGELGLSLPERPG